MGRRRKKAKKIVEKKRVHLSKQFKCPHCNYDDAVNCKMYVLCHAMPDLIARANPLFFLSASL